MAEIEAFVVIVSLRGTAANLSGKTGPEWEGYVAELIEGRLGRVSAVAMSEPDGFGGERVTDGAQDIAMGSAPSGVFSVEVRVEGKVGGPYAAYVGYRAYPSGGSIGMSRAELAVVDGAEVAGWIKLALDDLAKQASRRYARIVSATG